MLVRVVKTVFAAVSAAIIAIGAVLLIWPGVPNAALCVILGAASIACGAVRLAGYFSNDLYRLAFQFDLAAGILTILMGAVLLLRPERAASFLPVVIGFYVMADSALRLQTSVDARQFGMKKWNLIWAASVGGILLGLILLLHSFANRTAMLRLLGLTLLADGAGNLVTGLYTVKVPRRSHADQDTQ